MIYTIILHSLQEVLKQKASMPIYLSRPPIFEWCVVLINGFKPEFGSSSTNHMLDILGELGVELEGFI